MIEFQNDLIDRYNRQYAAGKFIKSVIVTVNPETGAKKYWADHEDPIVFEGQIYQPLMMHWDQIKTTGTMMDIGAEIALSNVGNQVVHYLKETGDVNSGFIIGNEVILQQLHLDLLSTLTNHYKRKLKIIAIRADVNAAIFTLGRELGQNRLPRRMILPEEQG